MAHRPSSYWDKPGIHLQQLSRSLVLTADRCQVWPVNISKLRKYAMSCPINYLTFKPLFRNTKWCKWKITYAMQTPKFTGLLRDVWSGDFSPGAAILTQCMMEDDSWSLWFLVILKYIFACYLCLEIRYILFMYKYPYVCSFWVIISL